MEVHQPLDADGRDLKVGDWVRVIAAPLSIIGMPSESLDAFSRAIGHTFQIDEFDEWGCLSLDLSFELSFDFIYIEPYCVRRFRRYKKLSKAFQRRLAVTSSLDGQPMLEIDFDAVLHSVADIESFGQEAIYGATGGSFAVWPEQRRVRGSIMVEADNPNAQAILESARAELISNHAIESIQISKVRRSRET